MNVQLIPTAVIPMQPAATQMVITPVLATLDTMAMVNNAQVKILLLSEYNVICSFYAPASQVRYDRYKTKAH